MIFLPAPNPDEMLYSWLARYGTRSGYLSYKSVVEDLYVNPYVRPNPEFMNKMTESAIDGIRKYMSLEEMIFNHTMYPYYARFYPKEVKKAAFNELKENPENIRNVLTDSLRRYGESRYLRYCPICLKEDRESEKGEGYWRRSHQLPGVTVCPKHQCYLCDSEVLINGTRKCSLISAEEAIEVVEDAVYTTNDLEKKVSQYITEVFMADFNMESDGNIGRFLHSRLATKYLSPRGQNRKMKLLVNDFNAYYAGLCEKGFCEEWQLQKVFSGSKWDMHQVCLLSIFLNISVEDLLQMDIPKRHQGELFDEKVKALKAEGKTCTEIAGILDVYPKMVQFIYYDKYFNKKPRVKKEGVVVRETRDWNSEDEQTLPLVKDVIDTLRGNDFDKPQKISFNAIEKMLNITAGGIKQHLLKCEEEIRKQQEPLEKYWARKVIWAVKEIERQCRVLNWYRIQEVASVRKKDFVACIPYLKQMADEETMTVLSNILNSICSSVDDTN